MKPIAKSTAALAIAIVCVFTFNQHQNLRAGEAAIDTGSAAEGEPILGEIRMFAANFPPKGWAACEGQLLPIQQNSALFSLLGTTYGGDGRQTFALPDLRSRVPVGVGTGPGLAPKRQGQRGGSEQTTLLSRNVPPQRSLTFSPQEAEFKYGHKTLISTEQKSNGVTLGAEDPTPFNVMQPYLTVRFIIAVEGAYPSRN